MERGFKRLFCFYTMVSIMWFCSERITKTIYPEQKDIFNAFNATSFGKTNVVIIGQDPYHNPDQAHGLCFSVPDNITPPPSLKNIYKEILFDCGIEKDVTNGDLTNWAEQGVLLLNSVLTVEKNIPGSHAKKGWEEFTSEVIKKISEGRNHVVFFLWGNYAKQKGAAIDRSRHLVLESPHPSPFSAYTGFFGSRHFSQTNDYLKRHGKTSIQW
jgi:uracil-DNA glycosylase